jgi:hypothetical protein
MKPAHTKIKIKQDCAHMKTRGARPLKLHNLYHHVKHMIKQKTPNEMVRESCSLKELGTDCVELH